jgi:KDO2-lipid IV(A) lauroyltransferase
MKNSSPFSPFYILSLMPQKALHVLLNILFFFLYPVLFYRKEIVMSNLERVFPKEPNAALKKIQKAFYRQFLKNFEDLIPHLSQSELDIKKSIVFENIEIWDELIKLNKPIIIATAHYGSWEKAFSTLPLFIKSPVGLVYTPLKNNFFSELLIKIRTRFGLNLVTRYDFKQHISSHLNQTFAYILPADQRPVDTSKSYWTSFLGIHTPILFGVEKYATQYNSPVIYMHIKDLGNQCLIGFTLICKESKETDYGFITKKYVKLLENQIYDDPNQWLWSHRRWKNLD